MAHVEIDRREFEELLGRSVTDRELEEKASNFGVHWNHVEGPKWDVEVYPNRPDLLSVEGLARAYRGFFDVYTGIEEYEVSDGDVEVEVEPSVDDVRPYIGGVVVRGLDLSTKKINGLIQLQEKLHETIGRRRDKIAIGLHDLADLKPPFTYRAVEPDGVSFRPLEHSETLSLEEILEDHEKGREYAWILEDEEAYPVIVDSDDQVLSFPPIINNQLTEVHEGTSDVFVDVTGKDLQTVRTVLNILVTALDERGGEVESVTVDGDEMPELEPGSRQLDPEYFRSVSGLELTDEEVVERLEEMKYAARLEDDLIKVEVPSYRNDVMHSYDLIEDVVIAHRYTEIEPELPEIDQIGEQKALSDFTDLLRDIMVGAGAMETHTYVLSSEEKLFGRMNREEGDTVAMSNALTEDYSVVRSSLLPSLMQSLRENRHQEYPQSLFEVADVAEPDESDVGASNARKVAYVTAGPEKGFTDAKEVLQIVKRDLGVELNVEATERSDFMDQRSGKVKSPGGEAIGTIGQLRDEVKENWGLEHPVAGFELEVESLMQLRGR